MLNHKVVIGDNTVVGTDIKFHFNDIHKPCYDTAECIWWQYHISYNDYEESSVLTKEQVLSDLTSYFKCWSYDVTFTF